MSKLTNKKAVKKELETVSHRLRGKKMPVSEQALEHAEASMKLWCHIKVETTPKKAKRI